jgi:thiamine-phosphate pyrophosphorylase
MSKKLYVVTNRQLIEKGNIFSVIENAVQGGADAVILREKDLPSNELLLMAKKLKAITDKGNIPLIINNNIEVATEINAYGYHTSFQNFINTKIKFQGAKGVSVHSLQEALKAEKLGADYLLSGHVFETDCKKGLKGRGISFIKEICNQVYIPVVAIGGISEKNIAEVLNCGAYGIAVMSSVMTAENPYVKTSSLKKHFIQFTQ